MNPRHTHPLHGQDQSPGQDGAPVALVAGASRGLGLLVARELGRRGHQVVICARDVGELRQGAELLADEGLAVTTRVCDVRDRSAIEAMVRDVETAVGPIHTLVTVAGIIMVGPLESMTEEDFRAAIDTMVWGPVHLALAVLPGMRQRRSGHIGTVTSIGGMVSVPHLVPYCVAKFGGVGFSQGLAAELAGTGVTATTIVPGLMRTGAHLHALFAGQQEREYVWFAASGSLPLIAMDAERAARQLVHAVLAGKPTVILSPLAKIAVRVHGLAPSTTVRVMGLAQRFLPNPPADGSDIQPGHVVDRRLNSRLFETVIALGQRAAKRFNETTSARAGSQSDSSNYDQPRDEDRT